MDFSFILHIFVGMSKNTVNTVVLDYESYADYVLDSIPNNVWDDAIYEQNSNDIERLLGICYTNGMSTGAASIFISVVFSILQNK